MKLEDLLQLLLAVGAGGVIVEVIRSLFQRRKMGADYADVIASSAVKLLEPLERRIRELELELEAAKKEQERLKAELHSTREELRNARREVRELVVEARENGREDK